jgi:hypothetical protein
LEHLKDPWTVLKGTTNFLTNSGFVIISIPNVRRYTTIFNLLFRGNWPYRERGIHDKNHLRFFTFKNIKKMLLYTGLIETTSSLTKFLKYLLFTPLRILLHFNI